MAPIVRNSADGERELVMARWGMPGPPQFGGQAVTNIRNTLASRIRSLLAGRSWPCSAPLGGERQSAIRLVDGCPLGSRPIGGSTACNQTPWNPRYPPTLDSDSGLVRSPSGLQQFCQIVPTSYAG
jgi:hypothetical protein